MSMSLFKSPEYAQEVCAAACSINAFLARSWSGQCSVFGGWQVWSWLDKHGDTPVLRENFKHMIGICTLRPSKKAGSKQLLQRRPSGPQEAAASAKQVSEHAQTLVQQGSTRFVPAASISGKPAPPTRPASAAATRRKHATAPRPSTAAPSKLDPCLQLFRLQGPTLSSVIRPLLFAICFNVANTSKYSCCNLSCDISNCCHFAEHVVQVYKLYMTSAGVHSKTLHWVI